MAGAGERDVHVGSSAGVPLLSAMRVYWWGQGDTGKGTVLDCAEEETRSPSWCDGDKGDSVLTHPHSRPPAWGVCKHSSSTGQRLHCTVCPYAECVFPVSQVESSRSCVCV